MSLGRNPAGSSWVPSRRPPGTHRGGQPLQSGARNAKNAPASTICGVLPNRPAPTGRVPWLVPISNPRTGDGSNRRLELEPCASWLEVKGPANCVLDLRNCRGIKPPTAVGQFVRFRRADSLGLGRGPLIVSQKIAKGTKSFVVFAAERAE